MAARPLFVMAGLDPAIHVLRNHRIEPGDDDMAERPG
jgi:hypothetical protein